MAGLIRRDLTSAFKLLRDRSDHTGGDFYNLEQDEKEQLIEDDDDVVHFSASTGKWFKNFSKFIRRNSPSVVKSMWKVPLHSARRKHFSLTEFLFG